MVSPNVTARRPSPTELLADGRGVRDRGVALGHHQRHAEHGLEGGLVPARERAARVDGLELRGRHDVRPSVRALEGRAIEAVELVVQDPLEGDAEAPLSGPERAGEAEVHAVLRRRVERCRALEPGPFLTLGHHARDRELDGIQLDVVGLVAHLDLDDLLAGVGRALEIGLEPDVVAARDDGPGQAMAVHVTPLSELRRRPPVRVDTMEPPRSRPAGPRRRIPSGGTRRIGRRRDR